MGRHTKERGAERSKQTVTEASLAQASHSKDAHHCHEKKEKKEPEFFANMPRVLRLKNAKLIENLTYYIHNETKAKQEFVLSPTFLSVCQSETISHVSPHMMAKSCSGETPAWLTIPKITGLKGRKQKLSKLRVHSNK